ncbi:MAG: NAD(P)-dependent alcohol dehydrogenase [Bryobacteraceae bacterium]
MRCWELRHFGLDGLTLANRTDPHPGPGQVLVRVRAASLNYRDWLMVAGKYNPRQKLPLIPCSDGAGEIVETGPGVERLKPGDRVMGVFSQGWLSGRPDREKIGRALGGPVDGMLTQLAVFPEEGVVHTPAHLTDAEAAALPCAAVTAWNAVIEQGAIKAGDAVLVQGTGGVSLFALQFAKLAGARVIVTSSSDEKLERALAMGADDGINYRTNPDWAKRTRELTDGVGVDHIVEVGGAGTLGQSLKAVRVGGAISVIGVLAGNASELNVIPILMQNIRLQGVMVGSRETFEALNRAIAQNMLKPVVDRVVPFEDAPAAFEHLASAAHFGKVCLAWN